MGNDVTKEEKQEQKILREPKVGQASDLYWASRTGDVDAVKQILATASFNDLNRLELNGSTALHAASFYGHADVVRLLLQERGVMRHRKNSHGHTAYEEAATDEIRQLFYRPNNNRFCKDSTDDKENIFDLDIGEQPEDDQYDYKAPDDWVAGYDNEHDIKLQGAGIKFAKIVATSPILRTIGYCMFRNEEQSEGIDALDIKGLKEFIDKHVNADHPEYDKACALLPKYSKTKRSEYLLRLYTLETPFCYQLGTNHEAGQLWCLLLLRLESLKGRAFHGRSYRGLSMTKTDFRAYQWGLRNKKGIIMTKSFCSTSVDEAVARRFMSRAISEKLNILMIFEFPQLCDTVIQLYALSPELLCISEFENEREVLVFPMTMFCVVNITNENSNNEYIIHLQNVVPKLEVKALWSEFRKVVHTTNSD